MHCISCSCCFRNTFNFYYNIILEIILKSVVADLKIITGYLGCPLVRNSTVISTDNESYSQNGW